MEEGRQLLIDLAKMMAGDEPPGPRPLVKGHPKLHVLLGLPLPELTASLRSRIPPSKYLLHIHPPSPEAAALRSSRPPGERTLFLESSESPRFLALFRAFLKVLRPDHADLAVQENAGPAMAALSRTLNDALNLEMPNLQVDRMTNLTRLRCSLANLGLIGSSSRVAAKLESPGVPAIVCGAGPSLAEQMDDIKRLSPSCVVVASGHAALRLKEAGVEPDFVVEADPRCRINWRPSSPRFDCPLVALTCVDPEVAARFERHVWLEGDSSEFSSIAGLLGLSLPRLAISRGVIVTAIDFALSLGCGELALAGCDLALSKSGETHPGERRADGDEMSVVEVEGQEPGSVLKSTRDFDDIRKALESYLADPVRQRGNLVNCSPSGAKIKGAPSMSLSDFAKRCENGAAKSLVFEPLAPPVGLKEAAASISKGLSSYLSASASLSEAAWRLERELNNSVFNREKVSKLKDSFDAASVAEAKLFSNPFLSKILPLPKYRSDDVFEEAPGCNPPPEDAVGQLKLLRRKYKMISALCSDLKGDVDFSLAALDGKSAIERDPSSFQAFKDFALDFIAKSNPELSEALGKKAFASAESAGFSIHLLFEDVPQVVKLPPDGSRVPFSGLLSVRAEAMAQTADFVRSASFDPARHAAVFPAPGNYAIVEEFAAAFPGASCMIVEPWPELLQELVSRCLFLRRLPEGTPVVAASDSLKSWRRVVAQTLEGWRKKGLSPVVHWNPRTSALPEAKALAGLYGG